MQVIGKFVRPWKMSKNVMTILKVLIVCPNWFLQGTSRIICYGFLLFNTLVAKWIHCFVWMQLENDFGTENWCFYTFQDNPFEQCHIHLYTKHILANSAAVTMQASTSFDAYFSEKSVIFSANTYEKQHVSEKYSTATHFEEICSLPNRRYHNLLIGYIE